MIESNLSDKDNNEINQSGLGFHIYLNEYQTNYDK